MSHQSTATAGHSGYGSSESGTAWENGLEAARASLAGAIAPAQDSESSAFGDGQSEAEAQLYAYLDHVNASRPSSGFQPLEELNARLNEEPYRDSLLFPRSEREEGSSGLDASSPGEPYPDDLDWFEQRFGELKRLFAQKDEGKREIAQMNARLGEILARMDSLAASVPNGKLVASVDAKLTTLSRSLEETREQSEADAGRISRAAKEILAASTRMQEAPSRFEAAARQTVDGLSRTVAATASRAAVLTAAHMAAAPKPAAAPSGIERLEAELRVLNQQSRESGERTAAALDRVHTSLRDFLERGQTGQSAGSVQPAKRRASVHQPISSDSAVYTRSETGFGAVPASEPRLDTLLLRNPPTSDPNLYEALREAGERLGKKAAAQDPGAGKDNPKPAVSSKTSFLREEEKGAPLAGIAAVAFILLLVSAALFYLHVRNRPELARLSAAPAAKTRVAGPVQPASLAALAFTQHPAQNGPSLFSAADQDRAAPKPDRSGEDLEMLEAAARDGDRDAQFRIGTIFLNSGGMEGSATAAARWFDKAAKQGHVAAQFMLASMLERGAGVAKDEARAIALYRRAASAGHVQAMHNLGALLLKNDTAQSYREAASWFDRAAEAGLADSQYNLALLYEHGLGIEQDLSRAYQWYLRAAKSGVKEAAEQAGRLKRTLSAAEMAVAAERANSWQPVLEDSVKSADKGSGAKG